MNAREPTGQTRADDVGQFLTLADAAHRAPGRPSASAVWRWCRRGILSKSGERVYLKHTRFGGRIYTSAAWIQEFGQAIAAADARYFQASDLGSGSSHRWRPGLRPIAERSQRARELHERAERELDEAGL